MEGRTDRQTNRGGWEGQERQTEGRERGMKGRSDGGKE